MTTTGRRKPARNGKGKFVRTLDDAERAADAARLRAQGWKYREIAAELGYADESGAYRAVESVLKATVQEPGEQLRALEVDRYDRLLTIAWAVMERTHFAHSGGKLVMIPTEDGVEIPMVDDGPTLAAMDRVLKICDQRADLLGLKAAKKIEQGGQVKYVIEGVDLEALR